VGEQLSPLHFRYQISSPQEFMFRLYLFAFPGWEVRIDGQVVPTDIGRPDGFLIVPVPAGEHVVEVRFVNTPPRWLGWGITLLSFLGLLGVMWRSGGLTTPSLPPLRWAEARGVVLVTAVLTLTFLLIEPLGWLRYESVNTAVVAKTPLNQNFGDQLRLIGFTAPQTTARPGQTIPITLYWRAHQPLDINYQSFLHLLTADGQLITQHDKLNPADFPTSRWPLDKYIRDPYTLTLPPDLPPGEYTVAVGLWVASEGWRLPLWDAADQQIGDNYPLFSLTVMP
jgi:hypothetical protein